MSRVIGIDLIDVVEVRRALRDEGERYLTEVYTDAERAECCGRAERLAERFAAKEATMKALASSERLPWRSIAVVAGDRVCPQLVLSGPAAELAAGRGLAVLTVSFGRAGSDVMALVLGSSG